MNRYTQYLTTVIQDDASSSHRTTIVFTQTTVSTVPKYFRTQ